MFMMEQVEAIISKDNIYTNEPMSKHTTFRVGGKASYFIDITCEKELNAIMGYFKKVNYPYFVVGNGSNLLVSDQGYEGAILHIGEKYGKITVDGERLTVESGAFLSKVAKVALEEGLTGFEFAAGIPGTIGGAVVMNAGAYGGEMAHVIVSVEALDCHGNKVVINGNQMEFGYRTSKTKKENMVITKVVLQLAKGNRDDIKNRMQELAIMRKDKQPVEFPSAGSTFKRPEGMFAGKLIMDAGLKEFQIGGARVSEKHAGFIINVGDATATDIADLMKEVQEKVKQQFNVWLEPEVILLGSFYGLP